MIIKYYGDLYVTNSPQDGTKRDEIIGFRYYGENKIGGIPCLLTRSACEIIKE